MAYSGFNIDHYADILASFGDHLISKCWIRKGPGFVNPVPPTLSNNSTLVWALILLTQPNIRVRKYGRRVENMHFALSPKLALVCLLLWFYTILGPPCADNLVIIALGKSVRCAKRFIVFDNGNLRNSCQAKKLMGLGTFPLFVHGCKCEVCGVYT